jgi:hypothetical protein
MLNGKHRIDLPLLITIAGIVAAPLGASTVLTQPSDYSAPLSVRALDAVPPAQPTPTVTALSATELRLSWPPAAVGTISRLIWRQGPTATGLVTLSVTADGVITNVDGALTPASMYVYALQAVGDAGAGALGPVARGTTFVQNLPAPTGVSVRALSTTSLRICWQPGQAGLPAVIGRRAEGLFGPQLLTKLPAGKNFYDDSGLYPFAFDYWIKHRNGLASPAGRAWY